MDQLLIDLFQAYFNARKNKRNTVSALEFELNYEKEIIKLYQELKDGSYKISKSIIFIIFDPVQREIVASSFRDRVVHHLIYNYINPIFEPTFIYDSYSCRKGKGTLYGIRRVNHFIKSCSNNYKKEAYILKLDISGYFMSINKEILWNKIKKTLIKNKNKCNFDFSLTLSLIKRVVFHDYTKNHIIRGSKDDWMGLPKSKSLFFAKNNCGLPIGNSEKIVMRILDTAEKIPSLKDLGFNESNLQALKDGIKKTSGILLSTGPTGSGKTTTLYSILNILNQEDVNISTLEDPIEYELKGVNQSQVRPNIGFSFANGLRSILRQDPDIIMVGEIRDEETAELAIHAALTGHLVLSTLHTNDAFGAIFRLMDMKIESFLLGSTLKTIIAQRLARKLCKACCKEKKYAKDEADTIINNLKTIDFNYLKKELPDLNELEDIRNWKTYKAVGCNRCENTGYSGRIAIGESINIVDSLAQAILEKSSDLTLETVKKTQKFISLYQDGSIKVLKGITTLEEVLRVIEV